MLLFIFLDGIGLGPDEPDNPFATTPLPTLERLCGGRMVAGRSLMTADHLFRPLDAGLGVEGLPQSGTGQTTLFTGVNAAQVAGMHVSAYPTEVLREHIAAFSLLKRAREAGLRVTFANAYSPYYWQMAASRRHRHSATTWTNLAAGLPFRSFEDLARGEAVYWDITHEVARSRYAPELNLISPQEAGRRLAGLLAHHDLVLFESFLPDLVGHRRLDWTPQQVLERIDGLLEGVLAALPEGATLLITSDHGNLEDPATKGHTYNPVPLIVWGPGAAWFAEVYDLTGVTPAILTYLQTRAKAPQP